MKKKESGMEKKIEQNKERKIVKWRKLTEKKRELAEKRLKRERDEKRPNEGEESERKKKLKLLNKLGDSETDR